MKPHGPILKEVQDNCPREQNSFCSGKVWRLYSKLTKVQMHERELSTINQDVPGESCWRVNYGKVSEFWFSDFYKDEAPHV